MVSLVFFSRTSGSETTTPTICTFLFSNSESFDCEYKLEIFTRKTPTNTKRKKTVNIVSLFLSSPSTKYLYIKQSKTTKDRV